MKVSLASALACICLFGTLSGKASAMGQQAKIFEVSSNAGIWDHGSEFYLRLDLAELGELKNETFIWGGFHFDGKGFTGELVANQFSPNEKRFPARAIPFSGSTDARYFLIEVLDGEGKVIKEIFLKGPASDLPTR